MLHKHQVSFFACLGCETITEALWIFQCRPRVILRKRRICNHTVKLLDVSTLDKLWSLEGILVSDLGVVDIM